MSLRDRLLNRPRPHDVYPLRVEDDTGPRRRLEEARAMLRLLQAQGEEAEETALAAARQELADAEDQVAGCYEQITLRALPPAAFEALISRYPAREGTDDEAWDLDSFPRACLLACVESDLTGAEWEQVLAQHLSDGELADMCRAAIAVNVRLPDPALPKGWTRTRS